MKNVNKLSKNERLAVQQAFYKKANFLTDVGHGIGSAFKDLSPGGGGDVGNEVTSILRKYDPSYPQVTYWNAAEAVEKLESMREDSPLEQDIKKVKELIDRMG